MFLTITNTSATSESVSIPVNPRTNRPVGYAFVDVATAQEAEAAIAALTGKDILERRVSVQIARKPEPVEIKEGEGEGGQGRKRGGGRGRGRGRGRGGRFGRGGRAVSLAPFPFHKWSLCGFTCHTRSYTYGNVLRTTLLKVAMLLAMLLSVT